MEKKIIWWRLGQLSFWSTVAFLPAFIAWRKLEWQISQFVLVPICVCLGLSNLYLTGFSLWHWKYRYRGNHAVAWAAIFPLFGSYLPSLCYFLRHINNDFKKKRQYANEIDQRLDLPRYYSNLKSVFFVVGGALISWASLAAVLVTITAFSLFGRFDRVILRSPGKVLTMDDIEAFHKVHVSYECVMGLMCSITVCSGLGFVFLRMSRSIRCQLEEQVENHSNQGVLGTR